MLRNVPPRRNRSTVRVIVARSIGARCHRTTRKTCTTRNPNMDTRVYTGIGGLTMPKRAKHNDKDPENKQQRKKRQRLAWDDALMIERLRIANEQKILDQEDARREQEK